MADGSDSQDRAVSVVLRDAEISLQRAKRTDSVAAVRDLRDRLASDEVRLAVVGPFKTGKSSFVNSMLNVKICLTHPDRSTKATVEIRNGPNESIAVTDGEGRRRALDTTQLSAWVEADRPGCIEFGISRALLERGLVIIDVPGIAGPGSPEHELALEVVAGADAVLFLVSAGSELTASDFALIRSFRALCPLVHGVAAKTDLYQHGERLNARNNELLRSHGLNMSLVPVSAALRTHALIRGDRELDALSGIPGLVTHLVQDLLPVARATAEGRAARQGYAVLDKDVWRLKRTEEALREPNEAVAAVETAQSGLQAMRTTGSRWRMTLQEGFTRATNDGVSDLRVRLRAVLAEADKHVDGTDPRRAWPEIEAQLRRQVQQAIVENHADLEAVVGEVTAAVADQLDHDLSDVDQLFGDDRDPNSPLVGESSIDVTLRYQSLVEIGMSAVRSAYMPGVMFSALASAVGVGLTAASGGLVGVAAVALGGRAMRKERERQLDSRRKAAKAAIRQFVDEVSVTSQKELQEGLGALRSRLGDRFAAYAADLEEAAGEAVAAAKHAMQIDLAARNQELTEVRAQRQQLEQTLFTLAKVLDTDPQP